MPLRSKVTAANSACVWASAVSSARNAPALDSCGIVGGHPLFGPAKAGLGVKNMLVAVFGAIGAGFVVSALLCLIQRPSAVPAVHVLLPFSEFWDCLMIYHNRSGIKTQGLW